MRRFFAAMLGVVLASAAHAGTITWTIDTSDVGFRLTSDGFFDIDERYQIVGGFLFPTNRDVPGQVFIEATTLSGIGLTFGNYVGVVGSQTDIFSVQAPSNALLNPMCKLSYCAFSANDAANGDYFGIRALRSTAGGFTFFDVRSLFQEVVFAFDLNSSFTDASFFNFGTIYDDGTNTIILAAGESLGVPDAPAQVPLPAGLPFLATALGAIAVMQRRKG